MYPFNLLHKSKFKNQKEKSDFVFLFYGSQILVNVDIRVKDKGRAKKYAENPTPDPDSALISGCPLKYFAPRQNTHHIWRQNPPFRSWLQHSHPECLHLSPPSKSLLDTAGAFSLKAPRSSSGTPLNCNRIAAMFPQSKCLIIENQNAKRILHSILISIVFVNFRRLEFTTERNHHKN